MYLSAFSEISNVLGHSHQLLNANFSWNKDKTLQLTLHFFSFFSTSICSISAQALHVLQGN